MKKSTILLVAVVYIISFIIVGFFGISARGYFKDVYVEDIKMICPEQAVKVDNMGTITDPDTGKDYYYFKTKFAKNDGAGIKVIFKAEVYPLETSFKAINVVYDESQTVYSATIVDDYYIHLQINKVGMCRFAVESTDGKKLQREVRIAAT